MKNINKLIGFTVCVLLVAAVAMMFLPAVKFQNNLYNGNQIVFGYTAESNYGLGSLQISNKTEIFQFSFMCLLCYILLVVGLLFELVALANNSKLIHFLVAIVTVAAGVMFIFIPRFVIVSDTIKGLADLASVDIQSYFELQYGVIVSMVLAFVSGFMSLLMMLMPKAKKRKKRR